MPLKKSPETLEELPKQPPQVPVSAGREPWSTCEPGASLSGSIATCLERNVSDGLGSHRIHVDMVYLIFTYMKGQLLR